MNKDACDSENLRPVLEFSYGAVYKLIFPKFA